jgi:hypothetical protein
MDSQEELENLMKMISPNLKSLVTQHLFLKTIASIEVFKDSPNLIDFIVTNIEAH